MEGSRSSWLANRQRLRRQRVSDAFGAKELPVVLIPGAAFLVLIHRDEHSYGILDGASLREAVESGEAYQPGVVE